MKEEFGDYLKVAQARARIAELEAAAQSQQVALQALADGCDYVASQTDGYERLVAEPLIALGLLRVVGADEDGDDLYKRVRPAAQEGGV